jgi:hypothetical protein
MKENIVRFMFDDFCHCSVHVVEMVEIMRAGTSRAEKEAEKFENIDGKDWMHDVAGHHLGVKSFLSGLDSFSKKYGSDLPATISERMKMGCCWLLILSLEACPVGENGLQVGHWL